MRSDAEKSPTSPLSHLSIGGRRTGKISKNEGKVLKRADTLMRFTGAGDLAEVPLTTEELEYWHFNTNFYSNDRTYEEV